VGVLSPVFDSEVFEYSVVVPYDVDSVVVSAVASDEKATVVGDGAMSLVVGVNFFVITVTAEDDSVQDYFVVVIREMASWFDDDDGEEDVFVVTFLPGLYGTFNAQVTADLHYGDVTPVAPTVTGKAGWTFNGWSPVPTATVTDNAIYTAQWTQTTTSASPSASPSPSATAAPTHSDGDDVLSNVWLDDDGDGGFSNVLFWVTAAVVVVLVVAVIGVMLLLNFKK
jgi:hypothetical protein